MFYLVPVPLVDEVLGWRPGRSEDGRDPECGRHRDLLLVLVHVVLVVAGEEKGTECAAMDGSLTVLKRESHFEWPLDKEWL